MNILHRIAVATTQFINACTGGMPDETFCSRMWRKKQAGSKFATIAVTVLDWVAWHIFGDPNHCQDSYAAEIEKRHEPDAIKNNH